MTILPITLISRISLAKGFRKTLTECVDKDCMLYSQEFRV